MTVRELENITRICIVVFYLINSCFKHQFLEKNEMTDQPENVLNSISVPVDKDQHATETSNLSELIAEKRDLDPQIFRYTVKLLENGK